MDLERCTRQMERSGAAILALLSGVRPDDARWRPSEKEWSMVEVAAHLLDEEEVDFRARLDLTLNHPDTPWPPLDSEARAVELRFWEWDLAPTLARFREERARSVAWLRGLRNPDWSCAYIHPRAVPVLAGDLLGSWVAHDVLHLRQLSRILYRMTERDCAGHSLAYAGKW